MSFTTLRDLFQKSLSVLLKPFGNYLPFFILTLLLSSSVEVIGFSQFESLLKGGFIGMHHVIICYLLTLLLSVIPQILKKIYIGITFFLLIINLVIDLICVYSFHFTFDQEVPAILLGTNSSEAIEFIQTFIPLKLILLFVALLATVVLLGYWLTKAKFRLKLPLQYMGLILVLLCIAMTTLMHSKNWGNVSITKIYIFMQATSPIDLKKYVTDVKLQHSDKTKPRCVVMVIGESYSKTHSSLYGYPKDTNPLLDSLAQNGELIVFDSIKAPALHTVAVFKRMMSTYDESNDNGKEWFECLTIPTMLHRAGYHTIWISNQSEKGFHDNIISKYAELCDTAIFVGNRFAAMGKTDLDELVLEKTQEFSELDNKDSLNFYFVHLMGSHPDFKKRYSGTFDIFKAEDYQDNIESQREMLASYDNSVLYNDFIVNEIIQQFKDKEALILYFSDHALDIYDSRDDYVGHARYNDPVSYEAGSNIPFMIYMSELYKEKYVSKSKCIECSKGNQFCTSNLIYTIMDIIGVNFDNNNNVSEKSLLF